MDYADAFNQKNNSGLATEVASFKIFLFQRQIKVATSPTLQTKFDDIANRMQHEFFKSPKK